MNTRLLSAAEAPKRLAGILAIGCGFLMVLVPTAPAATSPPPASFSTPTNYPSAGPFPFTAATVDLNRDGSRDVVAVNSGNPGSVAVLLGNGSGGLGTAVTYPSDGQFPYSVATGDLNDDGNPDVVVTNINSNTVSVLLGDGQGGLGSATTYSVGTSLDLAPTSVAIGDLNGDGKPDLAVANNNTPNVSILLGDGNGGFAAATEYPIPFFDSGSVKIADLNGDGRPDLVVAGLGLAVLLGNGDGSFAAATQFSAGPIGQLYSLGVADLNGDGKPDLLIGSAMSEVVVLPGDGAGGFGAPTSYPLAGGFGLTLSVAIADVNGDGNLDLVATNGNSSISVWLGDGSGNFGASTLYNSCVCSSPNSLALGDLNGDGRPDVVGANNDFDNATGTGTISDQLNTTTPGADLAIAIATSPSSVISGNRLAYKLTVTDNGPQDATGVTVTDPLPNSVHFNPVSSTQGSCSRSTTAPKDGTVTCSLRKLANGASATIQIVVTTTTPGTLTNTATVSGNEQDPNPLNNTATAATIVIGT
jgi:uncharacterized repeat protein (TIGR01451 family)